MTANPPARILHLDDDSGMARLFQKRLEREGYRVDLAFDGKTGLARFGTGTYDLVAVDLKMPGLGGMEVLESLSALASPPAMIMITGTGNEEFAVQAMKLGASDYLIKDSEARYLDMLPSVIERALAQRRLLKAKQRAEQALVENEEKYRNVVELANDGILILVDAIIRYINPNGAAIVGRTPDEMIGRCFLDYVLEEYHDALKERYRRRINGDRLQTIHEASVWHRDGHQVEVEFNSGVIPFEGRPAIIAILRDITARKRMEEELLKARRLEAVGMLAGGIAHEFNNVLTGVIGYLSLMRAGCPHADAKTQSILTKAERAAARARDLASELVTFSKGGMPIRRRLALRNLLETAVRDALDGSPVQLAFRVPETAELDADERQLRQVFFHLAQNAREAMPGGGRLSVHCGRLTLGEDGIVPLHPGIYHRIRFRDVGGGIAPENLKRLFDPFFTTKPRGRGLGLAMAYSVIKRHDGHIEVESGIGRGTIVTVWLPAAPV
jgi:two-component system cell cycle sensor histidine kinase/response regulator CckA